MDLDTLPGQRVPQKILCVVVCMQMGLYTEYFWQAMVPKNDDEKYGEGFTIHLKDPLNSALMKAESHI